jgi:hypothetical protein
MARINWDRAAQVRARGGDRVGSDNQGRKLGADFLRGRKTKKDHLTALLPIRGVPHQTALANWFDSAWSVGLLSTRSSPGVGELAFESFYEHRLILARNKCSNLALVSND